MMRNALTLLEVLLALALLSAATAAGAILMRVSRGEAAGSMVRLEAAGVMRRWQAEAASVVVAQRPEVQDQRPWSWTDEDGRVWTAIVSPEQPFETAPEFESKNSAARPEIRWVILELYCAPTPGRGAELVFRGPVPASADDDARGGQ